MSILPRQDQVAGNLIGIYEAWYHHLDPTTSDCIGAVHAANFLKKSGLSAAILSKVWDLSDPNGKGYLDKTGFFVSLKLVAAAQAGLEVSLENVTKELPAPNVGEEPPILPPNVSLLRKTPTPSQGSIGSLGSLLSPTRSGTPQTVRYDWSVTSEEKAKYDTLFNTLEPTDGKVVGAKVREVMMNSKLPVDILGRVWDMADMDSDGALTRHEFMVAMHLVKKLLDGYTLPATLPGELVKPSAVTSSGSLASFSSQVTRVPSLSGDLNKIGTVASLVPTTVPWVVQPAEKAKAEALFIQADLDADGFVSGFEIKDVFLQSGLSQQVLAHLWHLCDLKQTGKLNLEQFALALWLVNQKKQGFDLPSTLTPEMVPPSMRANEILARPTTTPYSNPEIEKLTKELAQMETESRTLESEISANEADIRLRNAEVRSMTMELETLAATLKQLENQKREAQKRLDDLDAQVAQLRAQADDQEAKIKLQEDELNAKKNELINLKNEEQSLEGQVKSYTKETESIEQSVLDTQLSISQVKVNVEELKEYITHVSRSTEAFDSAISSSDASSISEVALRPLSPPPFVQNQLKSPVTPITNGFTASFDDAAFGGPIQTNKTPSFDSDPFMAAFGTTVEKSPVEGFAGTFGDTKWNDTGESSGTDPFGSDPFTESVGVAKSPTPALPPKKAKQPPPRPAPPKITGKFGPPRPSPPVAKTPTDAFANFDTDPFGGPPAPSNPANGFADFADFGSKFEFGSSDPWNGSGSASSQSLNRYVDLDFKEDPFKDMRYDDPFSADPFSAKEAFASKDSFSSKNEQGEKLDFGAFDDPFSKSGASDPFSPTSRSKSPWSDTDRAKSPWSDGFGDSFSNNNNVSIAGKKKKEGLSKMFGKAFSPTSEKKNKSDKKLAKSMSALNELDVAKQESIRLEAERRKRLEEQEKADLELALALSRMDTSAAPTPLVNDRLI
ncbi:epidermal growth factor receptor substrate 15-like 1 isoform X2 [Artemia franciscana]|uniref:Epidermal growth factor receptor substrate 15-like 1 n=1 Tax=Artemia franciscana TaxID=6661 RepID=A0AA88LAS2_ARTSF|nr:hypothetical protein QYM36_001162 [Artemia franciscana]